MTVCSRDWLTRENDRHVCIWGARPAPRVHPGPQAVQHGVYVMMSAKGLMCAHEATQGIVRLRIPSSHMILAMTHPHLISVMSKYSGVARMTELRGHCMGRHPQRLRIHVKRGNFIRLCYL